MTFPPLKSMYLLRGAAYSLLIWTIAISLLLYCGLTPADRFAPVMVDVIEAFVLFGLFFAPFGGWAYAVLKRHLLTASQRHELASEPGEGQS